MNTNKKLILLLFLAAVACAKKPQKLRNEQTGLVYTKAVYALPQSFDPILMNDTASLAVSNLIFDGLLRFTNDLRFEGALAESWAVDPTGKTYTFQLRRNAKFHDGSPIRASDVVASLSRAVSAKSTVFKYYDCILGAEEYFAGKAKSVSGLRAEGDDKVVIELKYSFPPFLSILAGATAKILPANVDSIPGFFNRPIGSGPFKVESVKRGNPGELILSRFEDYSDTKPKFQKMVLVALSEHEALKRAKNGEVLDLANFPLAGNESVFGRGKDVSSPVAATWIIGLNTRRAPFDSLETRRAFKAAVDAESFRKTFYPDAIPAAGYIPRGLPGHIEGKPSPRPARRPKNIAAIKVAVPRELAKEKEIRRHLESSLRKQGWNVTFVPMAWDKIMEGYNKKTLQAFLVSMNMDYPDTEFLIRNFESNNPDNFSGISDPKLDNLIRKARASQDRLLRGELYRKIASRIEDLALTVNLFHPRAHAWVAPCVRGLVPNILADYYIDYRKVEITGSCTNNEGDRT